MAQVKFFKVAVLPGEMQANAFYFVENGSFTESYLTNSAGEPRSVGNSAMINALVAQALANWSGAASTVSIVPDYAALAALTATLDASAMILVVDASGDPTVETGSALYAWDAAAEQVYKLSEYESMDVVLSWADLAGRPASTPADIDSAVELRHAHSNKAVLDQLGGDADGLTYGGVGVQPRWSTANW